MSSSGSSGNGGAPNKQSKWNVVRTVPKALMLVKRGNVDESNENPFKGITYKGRPGPRTLPLAVPAVR